MRRTWRPLPALLAVVMLLRALVPAGYMVAGDGLGGLVVTICHGAGIAPTQVPAPSGERRESDGDQRACIFAVSAAGAPLLDVPRVSPTHWFHSFVVAHEGEALPHVPAILRSQSPRAPPAGA